MKLLEPCIENGSSQCQTVKAKKYREDFNAEAALLKRIEIGLSHDDLKRETESWIRNDCFSSLPDHVKDQINNFEQSKMSLLMDPQTFAMIVQAAILTLMKIVGAIIDRFLGGMERYGGS